MATASVQLPGKAILLEEAAASPRLGERIAALALWFVPSQWLEPILAGGKKKALDDLATVIFSSGSTGEPKGVMLTHSNIASNIEQVDQTFMLDRGDCLLGVLPFFHSFGFTVTLWLPAVLGVSAVYHPSPLDLAAVGDAAGHRPFLPRPRAGGRPRLPAAHHTGRVPMATTSPPWPTNSR